MAAPVAGNPVAPAGPDFLEDGYQSLIMFASNPTIGLWVTAEGGLKPPGFDTGEKIPITTMHNKRMRTFAPRKLVTQNDSTFKAFYNPAVLDDILVLLGKKDTVTQQWPDESRWAYFGALTKFEPDDVKEGTAPTATCTVIARSRSS